MISLRKNLVFHTKTKHMELPYYFVREKVLQDEVEMRYVKTNDQVVDLLDRRTKVGFWGRVLKVQHQFLDSIQLYLSWPKFKVQSMEDLGIV